MKRKLRTLTLLIALGMVLSILPSISAAVSNSGDIISISPDWRISIHVMRTSIMQNGKIAIPCIMADGTTQTMYFEIDLKNAALHGTPLLINGAPYKKDADSENGALAIGVIRQLLDAIGAEGLTTEYNSNEMADVRRMLETIRSEFAEQGELAAGTLGHNSEVCNLNGNAYYRSADGTIWDKSGNMVTDESLLKKLGFVLKVTKAGYLTLLHNGVTYYVDEEGSAFSADGEGVDDTPLLCELQRMVDSSGKTLSLKATHSDHPEKVTAFIVSISPELSNSFAIESSLFGTSANSTDVRINNIALEAPVWGKKGSLVLTGQILRGVLWGSELTEFEGNQSGGLTTKGSGSGLFGNGNPAASVNGMTAQDLLYQTFHLNVAGTLIDFVVGRIYPSPFDMTAFQEFEFMPNNYLVPDSNGANAGDSGGSGDKDPDGVVEIPVPQ